MWPFNLLQSMDRPLETQQREMEAWSLARTLGVMDVLRRSAPCACSHAHTPSDLRPVAMQCQEAEGVVLCLHQAARSASPVTLDLNQMTLAQPEHLDALRKLCTSAASHVTLTNGTVTLEGSGGALEVSCSRLSFKSMEIVRVITATPPPPPKATSTNTGPTNMKPPPIVCSLEDCLLFIPEPEPCACCGGHKTVHVTLEDCTLRMEGDPRYHKTHAVYVNGGESKLRMDTCKLLNMHPAIQVVGGAQVELHDCRVDMVFGTIRQLWVSGAGSKLSLHGCTLVEEEGTCLPPASALLRLDLHSILATQGGTLVLDHTRVRMPLGGHQGRIAYAIHCYQGTITATDSRFEGSFASMSQQPLKCRFTRCSFSGLRPPTLTGPAVFHNLDVAMLSYAGVSGLWVENCTFTNAPERAAIQCFATPLRPEPGGPTLISSPGDPPLIRIKGCEITDCFLGIMAAQSQEQAEGKGRLTVEVEDTTIKVATPPLDVKASKTQMCVFFAGAVSATMRRCVMQASGQGSEVCVVVAKDGAHLAMSDSTVTLHGMGSAIVLGQQDQRAEAVIERTTIASDQEAKNVKLGAHMVITWGGSSKLVDCKIQGSDRHVGVTCKGASKMELVRCEIASTQPMYRPWETFDAQAMIILKDCTVGECLKQADVGDGSATVLDNTPYRTWLSHPQASGRAIAFVKYPYPIVLMVRRDTSPAGQEAGSPDSSSGSGRDLPGSEEPMASHLESLRSGSADTCFCCGVSREQWAAAQGDPDRAMPHCQRCGCVRYCSRECQVRNWSQHKPMCQYISQHGQSFDVLIQAGTGATKASKSKDSKAKAAASKESKSKESKSKGKTR